MRFARQNAWLTNRRAIFDVVVTMVTLVKVNSLMLLNVPELLHYAYMSYLDTTVRALW
jgi:hypothetical protein